MRYFLLLSFFVLIGCKEAKKKATSFNIKNISMLDEERNIVELEEIFNKDRKLLYFGSLISIVTFVIKLLKKSN